MYMLDFKYLNNAERTHNRSQWETISLPKNTAQFATEAAAAAAEKENCQLTRICVWFVRERVREENLFIKINKFCM